MVVVLLETTEIVGVLEGGLARFWMCKVMDLYRWEREELVMEGIFLKGI